MCLVKYAKTPVHVVATVAERARTMVIFDGEKRLGAYATFRKLRSCVALAHALAVFDNTYLGDGDTFMETLIDQGEVWWDTRDDAAAGLVAREAAVLPRWLTPLDAAHYPGRWHGGLNELCRASTSPLSRARGL